jgi:DNA-directed RNA polymerase subunit RPC12/RpoP
MASIHHTCDTCGSEFTIKYDETICESDPIHCPFCAEYMVESEEFEDEDE